MSIHSPRYSLPPPTLRPHSARVGVVLWTAFRERFTGVNSTLLALIFAVVLLQIIIPFYLTSLVPILSGGPALSLLYLPFASQVWFFFEVLLTASVGAGIIANDLSTRSITMYLSRPITHLDYLAAKASAVGLWLSLAVIAPTLMGTVLVLGLGYVSLNLAVQAAAGFLVVGILTVIAFTGLAVVLSAWAPKSSYAAASIFGILAGAEIVALLVGAISGDRSVLYLSVEQDVLAIAQWAFDVPGGVLNPGIAGGILLAIGVVALIATYFSLASADQVAE